jgi:hypothetical protein
MVETCGYGARRAGSAGVTGKMNRVPHYRHARPGNAAIAYNPMESGEHGCSFPTLITGR